MPKLVQSSQFTRFARRAVHRLLETVHCQPSTVNCRRWRQGFTILELLVVITIIAILSTIGSVIGGNIFPRRRDSHRITDVNAIKLSLEAFYEKNNRYPYASPTPAKQFFFSSEPQPWIPEVTEGGYSKELPKDPKQTAQNPFILLAENIFEKLAMDSALATHENPFMNIDSGTYIGTGVDNKKITLGFKPDMVLIKGPPSHAVVRISTLTGDSTKRMASPFVTFAGGIKSLDNDGFTMGTNPSVNNSGSTFFYLAVGQKDGQFAAVSYQGNGTSRDISVGFVPDMVFLFSGSATETSLGAVWRTSDMPAGKSQALDGVLADNMITAFNPDGSFSVGNDVHVNKGCSPTCIAYHAIAVKKIPGAFNLLAYTGAGYSPTDRIINGAGFKPDSVWIKGNNATAGSLRFQDHSGILSSVFDNNGDSTNWIKGLEPDGFKLGDSGVVNGLGISYFAAVWKETTFGAPQYFYLYNVSADRKSYSVWATLENRADPRIYDHDTAQCRITPPPVAGYNYCGAGF